MTRIVTREHWHQAGLLVADDAGKVHPIPWTASIQHLHPFDEQKPHVHQGCRHFPLHELGRCPDPVSSLAGEPPLLWNADQDPERTAAEGVRNLGRRRQRELGIEGQT